VNVRDAKGTQPQAGQASQISQPLAGWLPLKKWCCQRVALYERRRHIATHFKRLRSDAWT